MDLRTWRLAHRRTLADIAEALNITGKNPARTVHRYETGAVGVGLSTASSIVVMTGGQVTFEDLSRSRRTYLASKQRDKEGEAA